MGWDKPRPTRMHGEPQARTSGNAPCPSGEPQAHKDREGGTERGEPLAHDPGIHGEPSARDADEATQRAHAGIAENHLPEKEGAEGPTIHDGSGTPDIWEESHTPTLGSHTPTAGPSLQSLHAGPAANKGKARANPSPEPVRALSSHRTLEAEPPPATMMHSHTAMLVELSQTVAAIHCQMMELSTRLTVLKRCTSTLKEYVQ